jgi:L-lactate dehydrogenase complex protein LldG
LKATSRSTFLDRVATAARAGNKFREAAHQELPGPIGYVGAGDDPIRRLVDELTKVGAHATSAHAPDELRNAIQSVVNRHSIRSAVVNDSGIARELGVNGLLRDAAVEVTEIRDLQVLDEATRRDRLFAVDLGVAAPDWAIAETGTLVYASGPAQTRSTTLLPPVHLAVVDTGCILPDLMDLPAQLWLLSIDGVLPRNVALVTGPSKTGDIELKLTTGVHGPGEVHVLIWDPRR